MTRIELISLPTYWYRIAQWLTVAWCGMIIVLSVLPINNPSISQMAIPHADKLIHFTFYFGLAFLLAYTIFFRSRAFLPGHRWWILFSLVFALGAIIELIQLYVLFSRSGEWADLLANTAGALSALWFSRASMHRLFH